MLDRPAGSWFRDILWYRLPTLLGTYGRYLNDVNKVFGFILKACHHCPGLPTRLCLLLAEYNLSCNECCLPSAKSRLDRADLGVDSSSCRIAGRGRGSTYLIHPGHGVGDDRFLLHACSSARARLR